MINSTALYETGPEIGGYISNLWVLSINQLQRGKLFVMFVMCVMCVMFVWFALLLRSGKVLSSCLWLAFQSNALFCFKEPADNSIDFIVKSVQPKFIYRSFC
ncbi:hypothetical protein VN97_g886 [Penicillium thymicola]|uniref:Uncharacterized protein n=1 Tax=Penicillium thymicola TaxID=293382 RepID=A0AAI9XD72_PENTH|nr:hypothetical protein VN97_g886 [Penicillium thymicola]